MDITGIKSFSDALGKWQKTQFPPVILFLGDAHLRLDALDQAIDALLPGTARQNSLKVAHLKEETVADAMSSLFTYSLMGDRQVVRISAESETDKELQELPTLLDTPFVPDAYLLLSLDSVERKSPLIEKITSLGAVVRCVLEGVTYGASADKDAANAAVQYIVQQAKTNGKTISPINAKLLYDLCGLDISQLSHAISRLIDYIGSRTEIMRDDIQTIQKKTVTDPIYKFTEALFQRNFTKALLIVKELIEAGEITHPLAFFASIASRIRVLLGCRSFLDTYPHLHPTLSQYRVFENEARSLLENQDAKLVEMFQSWEKEMGVVKPKKADISLLFFKRPKASVYPIYLGCVTANTYTTDELTALLIHIADADSAIKTGADPMQQLTHFISLVSNACDLHPKQKEYAWDF